MTDAPPNPATLKRERGERFDVVVAEVHHDPTGAERDGRSIDAILTNRGFTTISTAGLFLARRNAFEFRRVRNIDVSSNNVTLTPTIGCGKRAGVLLVDSHTVGITSNIFSGANNVLVADALSTGITATGNSTN